MARPATGSVVPHHLSDDSFAFQLRFRAYGERESLTLHERPGCVCGCGGGWDERSARHELGNVLARVRAGVWERPAPIEAPEQRGRRDEARGYSAVADWWLAAKVSGEIGDAPIKANTKNDYKWRLGYSKAYFGEMPVDEIDTSGELAFRAHLIAKAEEQRKALEAGADLREPSGRKLRPLDRSSIKKVLDTHASVLDEAAEEGWRDEHNPVRSKRMRIKVPKPPRTFLEMDELAALLDAAADQDVALPDLSALDFEAGGSAEKVARSAALGRRPGQIAETVGLAKATVTYHLRNLGISVGRGYIGRRAVCEILGRAGLRASELCDLKIAHVRLHAIEGVQLRVIDAKTPAGERIVIGTPDLGEAMVEHIDRLRRAGMPTGPDAYLIPNARGGRMSRQRVGKIVREAAALATERLVKKGLPPLPVTTPHTLRRTFISIALRASKFDVKWVQDQVGHDDSTMTTDVYNQLQHRVERNHGPSFDQMLREARESSAGAVHGLSVPALGPGS